MTRWLPAIIAAAIAALAPGIAHAQVAIGTAAQPWTFTIDLESIRVGEQRTLAPGDVLARYRIDPNQNARLDTAVTVTFPQLQITIPAGEILGRVQLVNWAAQRFGVGRLTYCVDAESQVSRTVRRATEGAYRRAKPCLFDSDGDGRLDRAFVDAAPQSLNQPPAVIEPVAYSLQLRPGFQADESVQLIFAGPAPFDNDELKINLRYSNPRHNNRVNLLLVERPWGYCEYLASYLFTEYDRNLPSPLRVFNLDAQIVSFDRRASRITLRIDGGGEAIQAVALFNSAGELQPSGARSFVGGHCV